MFWYVGFVDAIAPALAIGVLLWQQVGAVATDSMEIRTIIGRLVNRGQGNKLLKLVDLSFLVL